MAAEGAEDIKEFRIFYVFIVIAAFVMCFSYISRLAPLLLAVIVAMPVISLILGLITYKCAKVTQSPSDMVVEKKQDCVIKINIVNKSFIPLTPIIIKGVFFNETDSVSAERTLVADVRPFSKITVDLPFIPKYRGEYSLGIEQYEIFDVFKLFRMRKKFKEKINVVVLPRRIELNSIKAVNEAETDNSQGLINSIDNNTFSSFREYRAGDKMQHIHWKLTSKHDEFIVKHMEQTICNNSVVFCDFTEKKKEMVSNYSAVCDAVIETALAIVKKITGDGNSAVICLKNSQTDMNEYYEISDGNFFDELYYKFAVLPYKPAVGRFEELLSAFSNEINEQRTVYLLTAGIDLDFIKYLSESGLAMRSEVEILLFNHSPHNTEYLDYITTETRITLRTVDPEDITAALADIVL